MAQRKAPHSKPRRRKPAAPGDNHPQASADREESGPDAEARATGSCPVVGIGASAGGIEALKHLFQPMPSDTGMAFVVIQHLDPTHKSHMSDVLSRFTRMRVVEATERTPIEPNVVYTIPPNTYMAAKDGRLVLSEPVKRAGIRMPIDFFFRSLADDQHGKAIGVLLSGSGSDGTLGLREIRGAGGMVIVQDPTTAQYDSMPQNAILTGVVDHVLPLQDMPATLLAFKRAAFGDGDGTRQTTEAKVDDLNPILSLVKARTKGDFRCYKKSTIRRRVLRQMGLNKIDNLNDYLQLLRADPDKVSQLAKDMLIGVTSFFRDAEVFEELRDKVIRPLVRERAPDAPIRVWVPGCATGEEAYSIAMLLLEEMAATHVSYPLQIFASDVDEEALKLGRMGIYPDSIAADVSEERLTRFFVKSRDTCQINKDVRQVVTFAVQSLVSDPPFSKLDLISCRNVLIYFETELQKRVLALFSYALNPGGYLFLGKSDGLAGHTELFEPVSSKVRIYRRTRASRPRVVQFPLSPEHRPAPVRPLPAPDPYRLTAASHLNQRVLLSHFKAAVVLVDRQGSIRHFYGDTGRYLDHPTGEATLNLLHMMREMASVKLAAALREAAGGRPVVLERMPVKRGQALIPVNVTVRPIDDHGRDHETLAVIFEEPPHPTAPLGPEKARRAAAEAENQESAYAQLVAELNSTKEELQGSLEELETSNEELKASNEEVTSINEELQSTNEELETSKEELQSVNEELTTVNNQLLEKVDQLGATNSDLANLFSATDVAILFLDDEMRIRRFTPATARLMRLIPSDVGRAINDISHDLREVDVAADGQHVVRTLATIEKDVSTHDDRWYTMRVLPYRTLENEIEGIVITFHDVTRLKRTEHDLAGAKKTRDALETQAHHSAETLTLTHAALQVETARRSQLSQRLIRLQEDERKRIARELHDSTAQNLAGLGMNLALIEKASKGLPAPARRAVAESTELMHAVIREVRTVSYLLHPPLLEDVGLVAAVRAYVDGFAKRSGIRVSLRLPSDLHRLPLANKVAAFRIIQQCLTNIHRHAATGKAAIRVQRRASQLVVEVEDAGRGFPPGLVRPDGNITVKVGMGIASLHERLQELGGTLRIYSKPKQTIVRAIIPLSRRVEGGTKPSGSRGGGATLRAKRLPNRQKP